MPIQHDMIAYHPFQLEIIQFKESVQWLVWSQDRIGPNHELRRVATGVASSITEARATALVVAEALVKLWRRT